jgi:hypothetical protein
MSSKRRSPPVFVFFFFLFPSTSSISAPKFVNMCLSASIGIRRRKGGARTKQIRENEKKKTGVGERGGEGRGRGGVM